MPTPRPDPCDFDSEKLTVEIMEACRQLNLAEAWFESLMQEEARRNKERTANG